MRTRWFRITVHYLWSFTGKRWGWDRIDTHWGYILSISIGPFWILFDRFKEAP